MLTIQIEGRGKNCILATNSDEEQATMHPPLSDAEIRDLDPQLSERVFATIDKAGRHAFERGKALGSLEGEDMRNVELLELLSFDLDQLIHDITADRPSQALKHLARVLDELGTSDLQKACAEKLTADA